MQTQKGNLLLARARTQVSSNAMEWNKGPEPWITAVFIGLRQRRSWQGRIGYKGSLASANWLDFRVRRLSWGVFLLVLISLNQATGSILIGWVLAPAEDDLSSSLAITQPLCKGDLGLPWPPEACHGACLVLTFPPVFISLRRIFLSILRHCLILLPQYHYLNGTDLFSYKDNQFI